jgi:hypothetical protein
MKSARSLRVKMKVMTGFAAIKLLSLNYELQSEG